MAPSSSASNTSGRFEREHFDSLVNNAGIGIHASFAETTEAQFETDFGGGTVRDNPALNKAIAAQIARGRVGLPDDIGSAVSMLLFPASGQALRASKRARRGRFQRLTSKRSMG